MGKTSALGVINLILIIIVIVVLWYLIVQLQPIFEIINYLEELTSWIPWSISVII